MTHLRTIVCAMAAVLAFCVPIAVAQQPAGATEIGWLGLFNRDLVEWLENENQLPQLCSGFTAQSAEWYK
jgi:hypothetical protein